MIMKIVKIKDVSNGIVTFDNNFKFEAFFLTKLSANLPLEEILSTFFILVIEKGMLISIGSNNVFFNLKEGGKLSRLNELF